MNRAARVTLFSLLSGPFWSVLPMSAAFTSHERALVLAAAVGAAWITSWILARWLTQHPERIFVLGLASLPLGTFVYGVVVGLASWVAEGLFPGRFVDFLDGMDPLTAGIGYAVLSTCTFMVILLLPCAICTTYFLREIVAPRRRRRSPLPARPDFRGILSLQ